jgi:hypothetical protein
LSRFLSSHRRFFQKLIPATEQRIKEHELKSLGYSVPNRVSGFMSLISFKLTTDDRPTVFNGL